MILNLGEALSYKFVDSLKDSVRDRCVLWNLYGPAEVTIVSTYHQISQTYSDARIPIGRPLPNYHCIIMDEFLRFAIIGQEGELFVGGIGVFAGYLGRDDLTAKGLVEINGEIFYRTGDLVRMDNNGDLHYLGRKDHQIKLHGQRIELGEIERCLLDTSISACVVTKWGDDHLVAYVQSSDIDGGQLREHCESHLPPHMIPSIFIVMEQLPLNANSKIDRKLLPTPSLSFMTLPTANESSLSHNELEEQVHNVWCHVIRCVGQRIPTTTSFFSIGGHSLLFIELYHRYQVLFHFDTHEIFIAPFLQQPTIGQHAQLLQTIIGNRIERTKWHTLHINQGRKVQYSFLS